MSAPSVGPAEAVALVGLAIACVTDLRSWRIPNTLNLCLLVAGLTIHLSLGQPLVGVIGLIGGFAIHFPLWVLGVQKGGDAKLMIALGAALGLPMLVEATLWKLILLLPVGLLVLGVTGRWRNLLPVLLHLRQRTLAGGATEPPPPLTYMPFAPVIAAAVIAAWWTDLLDFF
jgi:prepilin peptidase CpaA